MIAKENQSKQQCSNPLFVVGVFRSGTSLLYALLNQHPGIGLMYEGNLQDFPESLGRFRLSRNWLERQEFYNGALSRHRLVLGKNLSGLEDIKNPGDLYRAFGQLKEARVWGEKSPFYPLRLAQLGRAYPNCAMILIWRAPGEIYDSVMRAARTSSFFRRPGMLDRTLYYQEQMIRQSAALERAGIRLHHLTYDELVGQTEKVCRDLCGFLGMEFDAEMLSLGHADFFPVNSGSHHEHLRRGIIARQTHATPAVSPEVMQKLTRYQVRWHRLSQGRIPRGVGEGIKEPGVWERFRDQVTGFFYCKLDVLIRLGFEFFPLAWLRGYRKFKTWYMFRRVETAVESPTFREQFARNWVTIFSSYIFLAVVCLLDYATPPTVSLEPFYLVPCVFLTMIVNRSWGSVAAGVSALLWSATQMIEHQSFIAGIFVWNVLMRFALLQTAVMVVDRIRKETPVKENSSGDKSTS